MMNVVLLILIELNPSTVEKVIFLWGVTFSLCYGELRILSIKQLLKILHYNRDTSHISTVQLHFNIYTLFSLLSILTV